MSSPTTHHTRHTFAWIEPTAFIGTSGSPLTGARTPKKAAAPRSSFVMRVRACASTPCRDGSPSSWPSLHQLLRDSSICLIAVMPLVSTSIHPTARGCIMESMPTQRSWLKVELMDITCHLTFTRCQERLFDRSLLQGTIGPGVLLIVCESMSDTFWTPDTPVA